MGEISKFNAKILLLPVSENKSIGILFPVSFFVFIVIITNYARRQHDIQIKHDSSTKNLHMTSRGSCLTFNPFKSGDAKWVFFSAFRTILV